jgi:hypothetical protein
VRPRRRTLRLATLPLLFCSHSALICGRDARAPGRPGCVISAEQEQDAPSRLSCVTTKSSASHDAKRQSVLYYCFVNKLYFQEEQTD